MIFSAEQYYPIYALVLTAFTLVYAFTQSNRTPERIMRGYDNKRLAFVLCAVLALFIGYRPPVAAFGDTVNYAFMYEQMQTGWLTYEPETADWLFMWLMWKCSAVMDVTGFFLLVSIGYVGCIYWACKRLVPSDTLAAVLFNLAAFSFWSYGVNGIRNGLVCSMVLVVFSYITGTRRQKLLALAVGLAAYNIHHAVALPLLMMVIAAFFIRNFKLTLAFWVFSIFLSLTVGEWLDYFFASLGFDERLNSYIINDEADEMFSSTGFRWDFLLYSIVPIALGWYVVVMRGAADRYYLLMLNTYVLSNAFWIMIIRASYSNRFAYLSWFIYPMILAYPLLRLRVCRDQSFKLNAALLGNYGFTILMALIER